ncbi:unnamed protein product [Brachionus calyciflorus]|uniref:EF-hand domain-containing protein n=1 Tax=Brachionus calyciflorus TaxID=104777 RepID=A0A813W9V1_9BILA|nr:unnamed protein product [Brachionus calyciflorus]
MLTEDELKNIIDESGIEDIVIKSWYKEFLLFCPKGKMDRKQFYKFYKALRGRLDDEKLNKIIDCLFTSFDKNSDGFLDFSEFLIAYAATSNGEIRKRLEFVFLFYDKDKDGFINDMEFLRGLESIYAFRGKSKKDYPPKQCVREIFNSIDANGDYKLNKEEFIKSCLNNKKLLELLSPYEY